VFGLVGLALLLGGLAILASAGPKIYWHFTFKAFVDPHNTSAVEWAWVTLVEYPRDKAFAAEADTVRQYGGKFEGTVFAFVRGAAWRSRHRMVSKTRCHDRPAEMEVFWNESESESVFAGGQLIPPGMETSRRTGERYHVEAQFRFLFTSRRFLREDGRWEDLDSRSHVFVGPIHVAGQPQEDMKGRLRLQGVNYADPFKHYRRCGKAWVEPYISAFRHFEIDALKDFVPRLDEPFFSQVPYGPRDEKNIVWEVHRTTSRDHPHWKRQTM
jgi:hypothetical protein